VDAGGMNNSEKYNVGFKSCCTWNLKPPNHYFHLMILTLPRIVILLIGVITMSDTTMAKELVLEREVILRDERYGAVLHPQAIVRTSDGDYVIAGRIHPRQSAWAIRVDPGQATLALRPRYSG
jgi:hypothetical protein